MTVRRNYPPFLPEAPIYDKFLDDKGNLTDAYKNWFNSITRISGYAIGHSRFISNQRETPINYVVSMTEAQRDDLESVPDGAQIYNTTTNRMNFRENGTWVTFTPIPA